MGFEYHSNKSAENKRKHGIDFEEAQELWADSGLVEIPARTTDEPRWLPGWQDRPEALVRGGHPAR